MELQLERQIGYEVEKTSNIILHKIPGQQVGIKLVTQQSEVRIFSVVPGSLAAIDGRLQNGDILSKVSNKRVRSSDDAAKEIGRVKGDSSISLTISRVVCAFNQELPQRIMLNNFLHNVTKNIYLFELIVYSS